MFKATPKAHRSLRHIAEEKNRPGGFEADPNYFAQGGVPKTAEVKGAVPAHDAVLTQDKPSKPVDQGTPFVLGGGKK